MIWQEMQRLTYIVKLVNTLSVSLFLFMAHSSWVYWVLFLLDILSVHTTTLHPFNGLFSRTTWVSRYQKSKTSQDLSETRDDGVLGWQWHQLNHMQTASTSLQTDTRTNTSSLNFLRAGCQWCIAKNGGGYTQRGVAKGLKVHCLFEVSIRCQKNPVGWYTPYTRVYSPIHHCRMLFLILNQQFQSLQGLSTKSWASECF